MCVCHCARHRLPWDREALLQTHIVVCKRSGQALGIGAPRRSEQDLELLARTRLSGSDCREQRPSVPSGPGVAPRLSRQVAVSPFHCSGHVVFISVAAQERVSNRG